MFSFISDQPATFMFSLALFFGVGFCSLAFGV